MYCPRCGWRNADDVARCANCSRELQAARAGAPRQPQQSYKQQEAHGSRLYAQDPFRGVPDYLVWSILVTVLSALLLCMCYSIVALPFGIVAIVKSAEANSRRQLGDYDGAMQTARSARMWTFVSSGILIAPAVIVAVIVIVGIVAG